jgi:hypothetical protein
MCALLRTIEHLPCLPDPFLSVAPLLARAGVGSGATLRNGSGKPEKKAMKAAQKSGIIHNTWRKKSRTSSVYSSG